MTNEIHALLVSLMDYVNMWVTLIKPKGGADWPADHHILFALSCLSPSGIILSPVAVNVEGSVSMRSRPGNRKASGWLGVWGRWRQWRGECTWVNHVSHLALTTTEYGCAYPILLNGKILTFLIFLGCLIKVANRAVSLTCPSFNLVQ